jgi:hypothetical protein
MKMGIGIGWPNATSGSEPEPFVSYSFSPVNCGGVIPTLIYSSSPSIQNGVRIFFDSELTNPCTLGSLGEPFNVEPSSADPGFYVGEDGYVFDTTSTCGGG